MKYLLIALALFMTGCGNAGPATAIGDLVEITTVNHGRCSAVALKLINRNSTSSETLFYERKLEVRKAMQKFQAYLGKRVKVTGQKATNGMIDCNETVETIEEIQ